MLSLVAFFYDKINNIYEYISSLSNDRFIKIEFEDDEQILYNWTHKINENIRNNTSPDLSIKNNRLINNNKSFGNFTLDKSSKKLNLNIQLEWFCKNCTKKIYQHANIYCCYDSIFCTPNCRDQFLKFQKINNNI